MSEHDHSILEQLADQGKDAPRVELRDAESRAPQLEPVQLKREGRYEIMGRLAEGGVGEVMRGRDIDLGRDVAVKMLRESFVDHAELVQRFVEEAQIGGQLQHPGIVPVYELGLAQDRPFFAMKLVKGETLAALMKEREDPSKHRRRLLKTFEQVCQTVAYAHSRGVVHRDLKPSNIMVGAFGEVQVLDWGFAKVLSRGGIADERPSPPDRTHIATLRSTGKGSESIAGSVMGTPAYMPPEQALGEVENMDERSDVFSLGAVLCEILTGQPPYEGEDILIRAAQADLEDALTRLDACEADAELVALSRECLNPLRKKRPRDANVLAQRIQDHLTTVEQRAHKARLKAEKDRQAAKQATARAAADARARRQSVLLAASVFLALLIGGGGYFWVHRTAQDHARRTSAAVAEALREAQELRGAGKLPEALAAAERAAELDRGGGRAAGLLRTIAAEADARKRAAERQRRESVLVGELEKIRMARTMDAGSTERRYIAAFAQRGLGVDASSTDATAKKIRTTYAGVLADIAACLDEWAWLRRVKLRSADHGALTALASAIDPDGWRDRLRAAASRGDLGELRTLAEGDDVLTVPVRTFDMLGVALAESGDTQAALRLYKRRPVQGDYWVYAHVAHCHATLSPPDHSEALRYRTAALALRPNLLSAHASVGVELMELRRFEPAMAIADALVRRAPEEHDGWHLRGLLLARRGHSRESAKAHRRAAELDPDEPGHLVNVAISVFREDLEEAENCVRGALRLNREYYQALCVLARVLGKQGRLREAEAALRDAIAQSPRDPNAYHELAMLKDRSGEFERATELFRKSIRLAPHVATPYYGWGLALARAGQRDEAKARYADAIARDPRMPEPRVNLGLLLAEERRYSEAIEHYQAAIASHPRFWRAHNALGFALFASKRPAEAEAAFRAAMRFAPKDAQPVANLLWIHERQGRLAEAVAEFEKDAAENPEDPIAWRRLGQACNFARKPDRAIEALEQALALDPSDPAVHHVLGMVLHSFRRDADGALRHFTTALRLQSPSPQLRFNIGLMWAAKQNYGEALRFYREACRMQPGLWAAQFNRSVVAQRLWFREEAIEAGRVAVRLQPRNWRSHSRLASALSAGARFNEAERHFAESIRLGKVPPSVRYNRGNQLFLLRRLDEAEAAYRDAVEHGFTRARGSLGLVHAAKGRLKDALKELRAAPEDETIREARSCVERALQLGRNGESALGGGPLPEDAADVRALAWVAAMQARHGLATKMYARAAPADGWARYVAACAAASAAGVKPDGTELRERALLWLRHRLAEIERKPPTERRAGARGWTRDPELRAVRDRIDELPEVERPAWRAFWKRVHASCVHGLGAD